MPRRGVTHNSGMRPIGILESVQVGTPHRYPRSRPDGRQTSWSTSFVRVPDPEPRRLFTTHLEGNQQADTQNHGTPNQAVLLYGGAHYPQWHEELGIAEMGPGAFGENFTIAGLTEWDACIGDTYEIGDARIQVTGPRYPCWKIEERWKTPGLTARVAQTGRTGWYCRVLREGTIVAGYEVLLVDRPCPDWTIALVNDFGHRRSTDVDLARDLIACPLLPDWWSDLIRHNLRLDGADTALC